jgi:hypothetical protein
MDERERRIGLNEAVFREANERIREVNETFATLTDELLLVCECGQSTCAEVALQVRGESSVTRGTLVVSTGDAWYVTNRPKTYRALPRPAVTSAVVTSLIVSMTRVPYCECCGSGSETSKSGRTSPS